MKLDLKRVVVCIVGLGYVGLPLAEAFAKSLEVIGFDINDNRIRKLNRSNNNPNLTFTDNSREISGRLLHTLYQLKQKLTDSGVLMDVRGAFDIKETANLGIYYYHL
jgi:UDP-N-acetyl-D-mannosaminuronate dehydrogenase